MRRRCEQARVKLMMIGEEGGHHNNAIRFSMAPPPAQEVLLPPNDHNLNRFPFTDRGIGPGGIGICTLGLLGLVRIIALDE